MDILEQLSLKKEEARSRMNRWAKEGKPFFFLTDFEAEHTVVEPLENLPKEELQFAFPAIKHQNRPRRMNFPEKIEWKIYPQEFDAYRESFDIVHHNILRGNSFLTNLTCSTPIRTNLSLLDIYERAKARYKLWIKDRFVVFSPETFVRIQDGYIYSHPMKGTINALLPNAAQCLLDDPKERAEHATITDLIRNDLSQFAQEVRVTRFRYLEEVHTHQGTLLQMSSEISGRLPPDYRGHIGDMLFQMLPAGSISGAPKKKTVEIIRQAERHERGFYTGVMGYFDGNDLDSAVLIRFIEETDKHQLLFKSGGGITSRSKVQNEYEEMIDKVYVPIY